MIVGISDISNGAACHPSPPSGGEGPLRSAKQGAGGVFNWSTLRLLRFALAPSPCRFAAVPLPLKGARGDLRRTAQNLRGTRGFGVFAEFGQYRTQDAVEIGHDLAVGEADHPVALALDKFRALGVMVFAAGVAVAVQFYRQLVGARRKIGGIGADRMLADKFYALQPSGAQGGPELSFDRGHFGAQAFGAVSRLFVAPGQADFPRSLPLRGCPSPPEGGEGLCCLSPFPVHPITRLFS